MKSLGFRQRMTGVTPPQSVRTSQSEYDLADIKEAFLSSVSSSGASCTNNEFPLFLTNYGDCQDALTSLKSLAKLMLSTKALECQPNNLRGSNPSS